MVRIGLIFLNILIFLIISEARAPADIYGYVDSEGTYHFTNLPVDKRYKLWLRENGPYSPQHEAKRMEPHIQKASRKFGVDPALIKAVIRVESNFNPYAVSSAGALGIMQLMPETATRMGVENVFDVEANIDGGTQHLRNLLKVFNGHLLLTLAAYNIGERTVKKYKGVPPVEQTQTFVRKVLEWYQFYRKADSRDRTRRTNEELRI